MLGISARLLALPSATPPPRHPRHHRDPLAPPGCSGTRRRPWYPPASSTARATRPSAASGAKSVPCQQPAPGRCRSPLHPAPQPNPKTAGALLPPTSTSSARRHLGFAPASRLYAGILALHRFCFAPAPRLRTGASALHQHLAYAPASWLYPITLALRRCFGFASPLRLCTSALPLRRHLGLAPASCFSASASVLHRHLGFASVPRLYTGILAARRQLAFTPAFWRCTGISPLLRFLGFTPLRLRTGASALHRHLAFAPLALCASTTDPPSPSPPFFPPKTRTSRRHVSEGRGSPWVLGGGGGGVTPAGSPPLRRRRRRVGPHTRNA